jgi:hypothetical protein
MIDRDLGPLAGQEIGHVNAHPFAEPDAKTCVV